MTRIFDNITDNLGQHLIETFEQADRLDAAVGYFNLRGWSLFQDVIESKSASETPIMRILVGMTVDHESQLLENLQCRLEGRDPASPVDADTARARKNSAILKFRSQLMRGLPTLVDQQTLQKLKSQLESNKVQIKLFTRRPLHGKTYLAHRNDPNSPIVGFVGSSNLTIAGLENNYELNVDVLDFDAAKKLDGWFEDRWNDKFCINISADVIELIEESWAAELPPTPYELFLKVCYHLSQDVREGQLEYSLPPELRDQLLEYQVSAVQTLARRIVTRGGTMLGDVVGLGKTLTAIATSLMLREQNGYSTLVVCPKNLVRMWEEHLDAYDVPGQVVSYSLAHRNLPDLRRFQFVVIDESHNLRSDKRIDYKAIKDYIDRNDSKVLLLTATPYNVRFGDVANQLSLYIGPDDDLGVEPRKALEANPKIRDDVDGRTNTMQAFRKSEMPEDWKNLMSEHLVRRTRSFIKANYTKIDPHSGREYLEFPNGDRFEFPTRKPIPIDHNFGEDDPAGLISSDSALDEINRLILPRYSINEYVDESADLTSEEYDLLQAWDKSTGHLIGITRTHLFKRLSSCGYSYDMSLKRHLARNELWIYALQNGLNVPTGSIYDEMFTDGDPDPDVSEDNYDALVARNPSTIKWVRPGIFTRSMIEDLEHDSAIIRGLINLYGVWDPIRDSKIEALAKLLQTTHSSDKVLIFSEYKDTAEYVFRSLAEVGIEKIALVTGETSDPSTVIRRFAPKSNRKPHEEPQILSSEDEVRILVTTDVLSEGQNLQDAHVIVNYDLPWAIIRLIQRAGRVDRVGQDAEEIILYTFFHESVENVISLRERIRERLKNNAQAFGSDEVYFGSPEETSDLRDLYNGTLSDRELDGDVDASSLAFEIWSKAVEEQPELAKKIQHMPDLVYSTRFVRESDDEDGLACFVRTENGIDGFGFADSSGKVRLMTSYEALQVFRAEPDDPTAERRADHFDLTAELVRGPLAHSAVAAGQLKGVRLRVWNRLSGRLDISPETTEALESIFKRPLRLDAERQLRARLKSSSDEALSDLLVLLHKDENLVIADSSGSDPLRIVCTLGVNENE